MNNTNPLYLFENNQTITHTKRTAREFGRRYWKSGKKLDDSEKGIRHIYRTIRDENGNTKIKRIKKEIKNNDDSSGDEE